MLEQQFGEEEAAFRTLDLYTSAVLEASLAPTKAPKPEWREVMAQMSKVRAPALPPCMASLLLGAGHMSAALPHVLWLWRILVNFVLPAQMVTSSSMLSAANREPRV